MVLNVGNGPTKTLKNFGRWKMVEEVLKEEQLKGIEKFLVAAAPEFNISPTMAVSLYQRALTLQADENRRLAEEQAAAIKAKLADGAQDVKNVTVKFGKGLMGAFAGAVKGVKDAAREDKK